MAHESLSAKSSLEGLSLDAAGHLILKSADGHRLAVVDSDKCTFLQVSGCLVHVLVSSGQAQMVPIREA